MPAIDEYSLAAVPLEMRFNDTPIASGTGFTWERTGNHYLITNWHNVSGRDPNTDRHISKTAAEPNRLAGWFNTRNGHLGNRHEIIVLLRDDDDRVTWMVHPTLQRKVDIVVIPLRGGGPIDTIEFRPINRMSSVDDLVLTIAQDVFVLGYPFGRGRTGLPIWKRGSIASEPQLVPQFEPCFLVDTASRPGMSGSPVIARPSGPYMSASGNMKLVSNATKFIGIYSGRLASQDSLEAQIGMVWPAQLIDEIIDGGLREHG